MRTSLQNPSSVNWSTILYLVLLLPWFGRVRMLLQLVERLLVQQILASLLLALSVVILLLTWAGMSFMAVMLLRVRRKKLPCGSQKALQSGKAAFTRGSMSELNRVKLMTVALVLFSPS